MTALAAPDLHLRDSWAAAIAEFGDEVIHGAGLWDFEPLDTTEAGCREVVAHLLAQADPATELPPNIVHCTYFWIVDDEDEYVGSLALRHSLTPWLLEEGGHIGYAVRPSRRREGHASRALALSLEHAADLGIDRALVTCDEDNEGSRATIERCGGEYEDSRNGKRRYWISTSRSSA
ncbi:GNAT family N-acetyltransferase [Nocardioides sp. CN2-186]|uniref:GNAT family N-acetyltransferase n=1 Tax=Nocardioides tweenelious TaxID=3156607 RepID=UPI0032B550B6